MKSGDKARAAPGGLHQSGMVERHLVQSRQDTSLGALLEAAILDKVERAAEALSSGREVTDAKQAADFLRMAPGLPRHAVTDRRFIYLRAELLDWLLRR